MFERKEQYFTNIKKIESEIICIIGDKQYQYSNGKEAYHQLPNNCSIVSIKTLNNQIVIQLEQTDKATDEEWQEDYKKQFGEEPGFF